MKWYFSGRTKNIEKFKEITNLLESKGEIVNSDWIYEGNLKPFSENVDKVTSLAERCLNQILDSDIFVVFNNIYGTDLYTETGIALAGNKLGRSIKIYVIGEYDNSSLMQRHTSVSHYSSLEEVFEKEGIDIGDFIVPEFE